MKIDTNPSCFFRDIEVWDKLRGNITTEYIDYAKLKKYDKKETIKILCVGCSSGEEAYSVSILMQELNLSHSIDALDIDKEKIEIAKKGIYSKESLENVSPKILNKYFDRLISDYKIKQGMFNINFMQKDAFDYLSEIKLYMDIHKELKNRYSIILCRSVLLMYDKNKADNLLKKIEECLFFRGILVLSPDDIAPKDTEKLFEIIHFNERIFRRGYNSEILCEENNASRNRSIKIIGFGDAGTNIVGKLQEVIEQKKLDFKNVKIIAASTSICPLKWVMTKNKLIYGKDITHHLGTGGNPELGEAAIKLSIKKIEELVCFEKTKKIILIAGLGGGSGSTALPYVSELAKRKRIEVITIFTKPFHMEKSRNATYDTYYKKIIPFSDKTIILDLEKLSGFCKKEGHSSVFTVFSTANDIISTLVIYELLKNNPNYKICEVTLIKQHGKIDHQYIELDK